MSNLPWISLGRIAVTETLKGPSGTSRCNHRSRMARTCSTSTSTSVTSLPRRASRPPTMPPIGPAPITMIRMLVLPQQLFPHVYQWPVMPRPEGRGNSLCSLSDLIDDLTRLIDHLSHQG